MSPIASRPSPPRSMHRLRTTCTAAALLVAACSSSTGPTGPVSLRVADASFTRTPGVGATVAYSVANDGNVAIRLTNSCGDDPAPSIERRRGGGWSEYAGGRCITIYQMGAVVLAPGAVRQASVILLDPGEYRLVLETDRGQAASAAFTVR